MSSSPCHRCHAPAEREDVRGRALCRHCDPLSLAFAGVDRGVDRSVPKRRPWDAAWVQFALACRELALRSVSEEPGHDQETSFLEAAAELLNGTSPTVHEAVAEALAAEVARRRAA